jgi:hypothetical protein
VLIHTPGLNHSIKDFVVDLDTAVGEQVVEDKLVLITGPLHNHVADVFCCVCVVCYENGRRIRVRVDQERRVT